MINIIINITKLLLRGTGTGIVIHRSCTFPLQRAGKNGGKNIKNENKKGKTDRCRRGLVAAFSVRHRGCVLRTRGLARWLGDGGKTGNAVRARQCSPVVGRVCVSSLPPVCVVAPNNPSSSSAPTSENRITCLFIFPRKTVSVRNKSCRRSHVRV